jgi:predicted Zn-dependent protease
MSKNIIFIISLFTTTTLAAQQQATIKEYTQPFPTYGFSDPSPLPLLNAVYPYFRYDGFTNTPVNKQWKVVELQNDYITILILPEIGGKIWTAIERSTNKPFLYYNHTVKFRDVAMRGPWTSGGLESNFGIIGHTPNCATPVDYTTRSNPDGSVSCTIGTLDLLSRSYWRMEIRLPNNQALFTTRAYWYNTTPLEQPYYHWMNAGLKVGNDLEFIYPGNRYLGHDGEYADWPVNKTNGKLISWYKNNDFGSYKSYHVFGKYTDFSGAYWHNEDYGMVRYAQHDEKAGKKLWIWGLSPQGMIWEPLLTDTDGQYFELQSGRLFNQNTANSTSTPFKHRGFMPYGSDTWEEEWYPVLGTKGFKTANRDGALNIQQENGWIKIHFSPTRHFTDTLRITLDNRSIYTRAIHFQTLHPFTDSVKADSGHTIATLVNSHLQYDSDPAANNLTRPVDAPGGFNWNTAYGNYIKGIEAIDQKNYAAAETALSTALEKDPNFAPALTVMANLCYRNMRYTEALKNATRALAINTEDGPANLIYGLTNEALGNNTDARDGFDIATLDPATRSAAYTCLARLSLKENDLARARTDAQKAIQANPLNMEALQLQAVASRPNNQPILGLIDSLDPLNHFAHFERYLANPNETTKQAFVDGIRNELPEQTFLELALWYNNNGLPGDALKVLQLAPKTAEINLWIAHLTPKPIDWSSIDPTRAFFFRSETAALLEQEIKTDNHWFLKYQLALIYHDRNRLDEAKQMADACANTPDYAPFYAFRAQLPGADTLNDLLKARSLDSGWRYQKLLTEYYIRKNNNTEALAIIEPWYQSHPDRNTMGILYAKTLLGNNQLQKADKLLAQLQVLPAEGATSARELYHEVKCREAAEEIKKKNYKKAKTLIAEAKQWPVNLGSGAPYPADQDTRVEDALLKSIQK